MKRAPAIFLGTSVLIAAVLSPSGGSFRLCKESAQHNIKLLINIFVLFEAEAVLNRKYPDKLKYLSKLITWSNMVTYLKPKTKLVKQIMRIIDDPKDAPVLAGALEAGADFVATLDVKHFYTAALRNSRLPFVITNPKDFFQQHWN